MTYTKYCEDMKLFNAVPMSEKEFNKMQGLEESNKTEMLPRRNSGELNNSHEATHETFLELEGE